MRRSGRMRSPKAETPGLRRDRVAVLLALVTAVCLGSAFLLGNGRQFLMPGPLTSAHGAIENCGACHTKSGTGKMTWLHGLVAGDPVADSKACLTCHKMPSTALNAHSASPEVLKISTKRLAKVAAVTSTPVSARAQSIAFPTQDVMQGGLYCATCHQEHKGADFDLNKITNAQCQSCHVVKFDSFDGNHPKFDNYPFGRRTRITYDHAGHFGKHFPEIAQKDPSKTIPAICANCHNSRGDKRIMAVASFTETCTGCHLDQITGKERASGPKGIAFLTLPGLDVQTLREKNAAVGEWPDASEAELTPFMKVMISRTEKGRALIKTLDGVKLQDLSNASDEQIKAAASLVWEVKGLFYALISGKASDVLGNLNIGGGAKLSANLVADLTASLPRDVVITAHQQWLPNLGTEMANRQETSEQEQSGWSAAITEQRLAGSVSPEELSGSDTRQAAPRLSPQAADGEATGAAKPIRLAQDTGADQGDDLLFPDGGGGAEAAASSQDTAKPAQPEAAAGWNTDTANARPDSGPAEAPSSAADSTAKPVRLAQDAGADPGDDLLFPDGGGAGSAPPDAGAAPANAPPAADANPPAGVPADSGAAAAAPQTGAPPAISIGGDVDPESWAEYGGWYSQDYGIFYRPTGHKDKFIYSWVVLTGPQASKSVKSPAAAVFDVLTSKDAQGSCTKCHSVDDIQGKGRLVNFGPSKIETKQGRFTNFIHEPHFSIVESRGCLTCHNLEKSRPYLKSYEQGNQQNFVSNFSAVKKELCQTCHTTNMARQDCLLCHKYHVNGVVTPIMNTRIPAP
jgi:hypothetical protein